MTWRLAARFADELNLDALMPEEVERALPVIRQRCEEVGRDPTTLRVSVHVWGRPSTSAGPERRARLREYADLGLSRTILQGFGAIGDPHLIESIAEDCDALGLLARPVQA